MRLKGSDLGGEECFSPCAAVGAVHRRGELFSHTEEMVTVI